jgi:hypothetical protein
LVLVVQVFFTHLHQEVVITLYSTPLLLLAVVEAVITAKQVKLVVQVVVKQKVTARALEQQIKEQQVVMV